MSDTRPTHYTGHGVEPIDAIEDWGLGFALGNTVKYISRAGRKVGQSTESDLRKALWYLAYAIGGKAAADRAVAALSPDGPTLCEQAVPADTPAGNVAEPVDEQVEAQSAKFHRARSRMGEVVHVCRDGESASVCGVQFKPGQMLCLSDSDEVTCGYCARFLDYEEARP